MENTEKHTDFESESDAFEENLEKFRVVVEELKKGDIPLERAAQLYREGVKLAAICRKQLDDAKIKITEDDADEASNDWV